MPTALHLGNILAAVLYAGIGITVFVGGFWLVDKLHPADLQGEVIQKHNVAVATVAAGAFIAVGLIIAAAIH